MSYLIKNDSSLGTQIRHCLDDIHNLVIAESKEVNSQHIASVSNTENTIMLDNGTTCFLSRKGKRLLKEQGML